MKIFDGRVALLIRGTGTGSYKETQAKMSGLDMSREKQAGLLDRRT